MSESFGPGKVLITGANRGLGLFCSKALLRSGWDVVGTARSADGLAVLERHMIPALQLDLESDASIETAVDELAALAGQPLFAVFHNAAAGALSPLMEVGPNQMQREMRVNAIGPLLLTQKLLPLLPTDGTGRVVFCSSILSLMPNANKGSYAASKSALNMFASALRIELAREACHFSTLIPGPIHNPARNSAGKPFFALSHADVLRSLCHALVSPRPKKVYLIGALTKMTGVAVRVLPSALVEALVPKLIK